MRSTICLSIFFLVLSTTSARAENKPEWKCAYELVCSAQEASRAITRFLDSFNHIEIDKDVPRKVITTNDSPEVTHNSKGNKEKNDSVAKKLPGAESKYDETIIKASKDNDLDPLLVKAIIRHESDFDPNAVSLKGAKGLMQLMPALCKKEKINPFNPRENIFTGSKYLRENIETFNGDLRLALAAYNAGPGAVKKSGGIPDITETQEFVDKVLKTYQETKNG